MDGRMVLYYPAHTDMYEWTSSILNEHIVSLLKKYKNDLTSNTSTNTYQCYKKIHDISLLNSQA